MAVPNYGTTRATLDHTICQTQKFATILWEGYATINSGGTASFYLKREDGSQGFYIPSGTTISATVRAVMLTGTVEGDITEAGILIKNDGGTTSVATANAGYVDAAINTNYTLDVLEDDTNDCIRLKVTDGGAGADTVVYVRAVVSMTIFNSSYKNMVAGSTTAST